MIHRIAVDEIPTLEARAWRDELLARRTAGARAVTLFGKRHGEAVTITAVLRAPTGALEVSRTTVMAAHGYHELTSAWPALHCFERELHEQTAVRIAGHPWLKPIRFEGQSQSAMDDYPFYKIEGKEVHEVAVGPIHAGVIEPGSFRFMCSGEQVHHLEIHLGYQHRGVEARLLEGDPRLLAPLVETIAGDTSIAHAWAYSAAIESLAGCTPGLDVVRGFALELERIAMHLASLAGMAGDIGFLQGATTYGRLRTTAINTLMRLCGSRFGRTAVRPGGSGMQLKADLLPELQASLDLLRTDLALIDERFLTSRTVQHRLRETGVLTTAQALELGIVGLAARASGVHLDLRTDIEISTQSAGDCFARAQIRILEIEASLSWLWAITAQRPAWQRSRTAIGALAPSQLVIAMVEGWRGEVVHCLETGEAGELVHYKVQDPSLRNWMGLAMAMRGNEISDFPICNKSFDLSYCGNDL
jgi:Ni,Fe-hydrogenase III large subunit